jgi:hypothetical protein
MREGIVQSRPRKTPFARDMSRWQVSRLADFEPRLVGLAAFPAERPVAVADLSGHGRGGGCALAPQRRLSHSLFTRPFLSIGTGTSARN